MLYENIQKVVQTDFLCLCNTVDCQNCIYDCIELTQRIVCSDFPPISVKWTEVSVHLSSSINSKVGINIKFHLLTASNLLLFLFFLSNLQIFIRWDGSRHANRACNSTLEITVLRWKVVPNPNTHSSTCPHQQRRVNPGEDKSREWLPVYAQARLERIYWSNDRSLKDTFFSSFRLCYSCTAMLTSELVHELSCAVACVSVYIHD